ncbi:MAG: Ig-like domain-containing protein [Syntrophotaleaceae bacterium]
MREFRTLLRMAGVSLLLGLLLLPAGCGGGSSSSDGDGSDTPTVGNSIVSVSPADADMDVPITETIIVTCAETAVLGDISGVTLMTGVTNVPVTVSVSGNDMLVDPVPLLEKAREYTLTLPAGAIEGVDEETVITFTTIQIEFVERTGVLVSDIAGASIGRTDMSNNIVVSETGVIHEVWKVPAIMSASPAAEDGIYYSRSTDGGASFEPSVLVRAAAGLPVNVANQIEPEISCSGEDNVFIAYPNANGQMEVTRSSDGGDTWQTPVVIGEAGTLSEQKHITAMGANVYISANDGDAPQSASVDNGGNTFIRSTDSGVTFETPITGLMGYPLHALLINPLNGDIYILGTEPTGVNEPTDVFYVRSTDGGETFEVAVDSGHTVSHAGYCFDRLGRIVIIARDGKLVIGDMNTGTWSESDTVGTSSLSLQSTMTVDGDNTIYRVGTAASDSQIHITYSMDDGLTFTDELIDAGSYPNAASSVNMSGVAMVYMRDNAVYFAYRNPIAAP